MNISENLLEYLKEHDVLELPLIGTFRVNYQPASISPITHTLTPPSKTISFYNEFQNDESFIEALSKEEFISLDTAKRWVNEYCQSIIDRILSSSSCNIGELGTLSKNNLGKGYSFTPKEGLNLLDNAFAFSTIKQVKTFNQGDYITPIKTKEEKIEEPIIPSKQEEEKIVINLYEKDETSSKNEEINIEIKEEVSQNDENNTENREKLDIETNTNKEIEFVEKENSIKKDKETPIIDEQTKEEDEESLEDEEMAETSDLNKFNHKNSKKYRKLLKKQAKKEKKLRKQHRKRNRMIWNIVFVIVLLALLVQGGLSLGYYMCWTKDIKQLKPLNDRLSYYITPRCETKTPKVVVIPVESPSSEINAIYNQEIIMEDTLNNEIIQEEIPIKEEEIKKEEKKEVSSQNKIAKTENNTNNKKTSIKKEKPLKPTGEKDNPPKPSAEIDYSTPILMQRASRMGFDVVGGIFDDVSQAQQLARKARSLGYDAYIINRIVEGKTKYYVSYSSKRTMGEANYALKNIIKKYGDRGFQIISR
ncbi:MAG: hypothetical protein LBM25_03095 [Bacteroidales bacterium]|jgi:nucleoid DNA-binding protein/cell division septation protein DedD|nr:hypothetical protein [Bacteroidales bacterium]